MEEHYRIVLDTITKATSQNLEEVKIAEEMVKKLKTENLFYSNLLTIACDKNTDFTLRWMSILCFKEGIEKLWRDADLKFFEEEQKTAIRQQLVKCLQEPDSRLAVQFGVVVSKIASVDCPHAWPVLLPVLLEQTQSEDASLSLSALCTLKVLVKAMATDCRGQQKDKEKKEGRFSMFMRRDFSQEVPPASNKTFEEVTSLVFETVFAQWRSAICVDPDVSRQDPNTLLMLFTKKSLLLKMLKDFITEGIEDISNHSGSEEAFKMILEEIEPVLRIRYETEKTSSQNPCLMEFAETAEKYGLLLIKTLYCVYDKHCKRLVDYEVPLLKLSSKLLLSAEGTVLLFEKVVVKLFNLLQRVSNEYNCNEYFESAEALADWLADAPIASYLSYSSQEDIMSEKEPEAFAAFESSQSPELNVRSCGPEFYGGRFLDMFTHDVQRAVKNMVLEATSPACMQLKKEAVYHLAMLRCNRLLGQNESWSKCIDHLLLELSTLPLRPLLKRRIVLWLAECAKDEGDVARVFACVVQFFDPKECLLVRLAAADAILKLLGAWDFKVASVLNSLDPCVAGLLNLLNELVELELIARVLEVLSRVMGRFEKHLVRFQGQFGRLLPRLWSAQHNALRTALLHCATALMSALGPASVSWHPFVLPVLCVCVDVSGPHHVYLLEEGIKLWEKILKNAPHPPSDDLMQMARLLWPLIELDFQGLREVLGLVQMYFLLEPESFLKMFREPLRKSFHYVASIQEDAVHRVAEVVNIVMIKYPVEGSLFFQDLLQLVFKCTISQPNCPLTPLQIIYSPRSWVVLCRLAFVNIECFHTLVQVLAQQQSMEASEVLVCFVDKVLFNVGMMFEYDKGKKMAAMGLLTLLAAHSKLMADRVNAILSCVLRVLDDVADPRKFAHLTDLHRLDTLLIRPNDPVPIEFSNTNSDCFKTQDCFRKEELTRLDPTHTVILRDYFYERMTELRTSMGEEAFNDLMNPVDVDTKQRMTQYLDPMATLTEQLTENKV